MKFRKLIFGLAVTPFLLASCNTAMSFDDAKKWITDHYKNHAPDVAIATVSWDIHGATGDLAKDYVYRIFNELGDESEKEGLHEVIPTGPLLREKPVGHRIEVTNEQEITPLNGDNFSTFSGDIKDPVYKVNGGNFTVTYKYPTPYKDGETIETSRVRVYNSEGFCTDFGCKVNGKWIDDNNTVKFKLLIHFTYGTDPID